MDFLRNSKKGVMSYVLSCLILCMVAVFMISPIHVYAASGVDEEVETVGDLYDVTTALTAYVNNVVGANSNDKHNSQRVENPGNVGNAGAYVGYGDEKKQDFVSFITSTTTNGASASTYDAWEDVIDGSNSNAAYAYVRFGRTLADAGLDETVEGSSGLSGWRAVSGIISMIAYTASEIVPVIFGLMLKLLKTLNIFALFSKSVVGLNSYWQSAFPTGAAVLTPLVDFVSGTYSKLVNTLSWNIIVPFLLAFMICSILLLKKKASTQIVNFVKRVAFIAVGVPICAGLYTAALDKMEEVTLENTPSAQLVAASFVDFESWANNNLNVPSGLRNKIVSSPKGTDGAVNDGGTASASTLKSLRTTALTINKKYGQDIPSGWTIGSNAHANLSGSQWNIDGTRNETTATTPFAAQQSLYNMMNRYLTKEVYTSSAWGTKIAKDLKSYGSSAMGNSGADDDKTIRAMFDTTDEVSDWLRREEGDNKAIWKKTVAPNDTSIGWTTKRWNLFTNGTMTASGRPDSNMKWSGKLSDVSMYNYLSTAFNESSIVTYSNVNSVSEHTQQAHASVTMTGNGVLGFLFALNMWVTIGITAIIGCYFSISMAFKNIKMGVKLLTSIPMAVLGVVKSIAQVIVYVIMMIAQLFLGAFMYSFISELLCVFASVIERLVANATGYGDSSTPAMTIFGGRLGAFGLNLDQSVLFDSTIALWLMVVCEIALVLYLGYSMFKYRRAICRAYAYQLQRCYHLVTFAEVEFVFEQVLHGVVNRRKVLIPVYGNRPVSAFAEVVSLLKFDREEVLVS